MTSAYDQGGDLIWGNTTSAPDDPPEAPHSHGQLISFRAEHALASSFDALRLKGVTNKTIEDLTQHETDLTNMTSQQGGTWILSHTPNSFQVYGSDTAFETEIVDGFLQKMMEANYSNGFEKDDAQLELNNRDPSKWTNPLEVK